MSNYELVQKKIIEAVPEILELKFGCEVRIPIVHAVNNTSRETYMIKHVVLLTDFYKTRALVHRCDSKWNKLLPISNDWEILGREIGLCDVLRAIEKNGREGVYPPELFALGHPMKWSLAHDSLSWHRDNAPEVIDFLAELLTTL